MCAFVNTYVQNMCTSDPFEDMWIKDYLLSALFISINKLFII